jgi:hypothetical protein
MQSTQKARAIQRYLVTNVLESYYETPQGKSRPELVRGVLLRSLTQLTGVGITCSSRRDEGCQKSSSSGWLV